MFDKKSRVTKEEKRQVEDTVKKSNIFFTKEVPIYWGDYSLVEAELELFETALEKDEYSMYHLLSGVDLPLDTAENIYNFFDENQDYSFIDVPPKEIFDKVKANERIKYYYLDTKRINMRNTNSKIMKDMFTLYRKLEKKFQKIIRVNRIKNVSVSYGSNWCSLNRSSLNTIINEKSFIEKTFKRGFIVDELVIHTTLSTFNNFSNLYNYRGTNDFQGNLRYINWWDGSPYTWTDSEKDIEQLKYGKKQGHLFSRKFDLDKYPGMREKIIDIIQNKVESNLGRE